MSFSDGADVANDNAGMPVGGSARDADSLLLEALIFVLIEKGVLTKNDALRAVQTVAEIKHGSLSTQPDGSPVIAAELGLLSRLYSSFELLDDRPGRAFDGENVRVLRPPVHAERPEFPIGD